MTSTSGTNHTQFHKMIFSAGSKPPWEWQSSHVAYGLYTMVTLFNLSVSWGGQALTLSFIVYLNVS